MNWSAVDVPVTPPGVDTWMSTVPWVPEGDVAVSELPSALEVTLVAGLVPKATVARVRLAPETVTTVPRPAVRPPG